MSEKIFEMNVGVGKLRVSEGEEAYGQAIVDLVVERDGREYAIPIVAIENPIDPDVDDANATTIYLYKTLECPRFTHRVKIPNAFIDDAIAGMAKVAG